MDFINHFIVPGIIGGIFLFGVVRGGAFPAIWRGFDLKYTKYFCVKPSCPAEKFLAAGHAVNIQTAPGQ